LTTSPCKFCGYPLSPTATECAQCGFGTPYGLRLEENQKLNRPTLIKCPACEADVSNQAVACPRCGQPMQPEKMQLPPPQVSQTRPIPKQKTKTNPLAIGCLAIIGTGVACVIFANIINSVGTRNAVNQNSSTPRSSVTSASANASPTASDDDSPDFSSERSREILGAFFIKPVLKQMLNDPDSLEDFQVLSVTPANKLPGVYKAVVFYRAKNAFGGLVAQ
jgi:hypothetical protein